MMKPVVKQRADTARKIRADLMRFGLGGGGRGGAEAVV